MGRLILFILSISIVSISYSQDTFSIVAVDSITGEVGSAGASCVDLPLVAPSFATDFLGELLPGLGAINTQAFYLEQNQINARNQLLLGRTPAEAVTWLDQNDAQGNPTLRQYGIAALVNGSPEAAAYTGTATNSYTGQRVGANYAIQGNILSGPEILDSMEARFLSSPGDLRCKLMAAMQGANVIGADSRCAVFGTSSLFAFLKVALPSDTFGSPSHLISIKTSGNDGIEPIDSLQSLFDQAFPQACNTVIGGNLQRKNTDLKIFPNPANSKLFIRTKASNIDYQLISLEGKSILNGQLEGSGEINLSNIDPGSYIILFMNHNHLYYRELIQIH